MSKPRIPRKLLLVDREDGSGAYNLMIETPDGRTLTKQLTPQQAAAIFPLILADVARVTGGTF